MTVTKRDRMARSVADMLAIIGRLEAKDVAFRVLSVGGSEVDTRTPTGKLTLTMLGAMAEFERALMLERQREGLAKAKAEGEYEGRVPTAPRQAADVLKLRADGLKPAGDCGSPWGRPGERLPGGSNHHRRLTRPVRASAINR